MAQPFEFWFHISIGEIVAEVGAECPHYSPDVVRDMTSQMVRALGESIALAKDLGAVEVLDREDLEDLEDDSTEDE
jgi:hypothetical protein